MTSIQFPMRWVIWLYVEYGENTEGPMERIVEMPFAPVKGMYLSAGYNLDRVVITEVHFSFGDQEDGTLDPHFNVTVEPEDGPWDIDLMKSYGREWSEVSFGERHERAASSQ